MRGSTLVGDERASSGAARIAAAEREKALGQAEERRFVVAALGRESDEWGPLPTCHGPRTACGGAAVGVPLPQRRRVWLAGSRPQAVDDLLQRSAGHGLGHREYCDGVVLAARRREIASEASGLDTTSRDAATL